MIRKRYDTGNNNADDFFSDLNNRSYYQSLEDDDIDFSILNGGNPYQQNYDQSLSSSFIEDNALYEHNQKLLEHSLRSNITNSPTFEGLFNPEPIIHNLVVNSNINNNTNNMIPQHRALVPINLRRRPTTPSDSYGLSEFRLQPVVIDQKGNDIDFFNDVNAGSNTRNILGDMTSRGTLNQLREADIRAMREDNTRNIYGELTPRETLVQSKREADLRAIREKAAQEMTPDTERNATEALTLIFQNQPIDRATVLYTEETPISQRVVHGSSDIGQNKPSMFMRKRETPLTDEELVSIINDPNVATETRNKAQTIFGSKLARRSDGYMGDKTIGKNTKKPIFSQLSLSDPSSIKALNQRMNNTQWIKGVPNAVTGGVGVAGLGGLGYMLMSNDNSEPDQTQYYGDYLV